MTYRVVIPDSQEDWEARIESLASALESSGIAYDYEFADFDPSLPVAVHFGSNTVALDANLVREWRIDTYWAEDAERIAEGAWRQ